MINIPTKSIGAFNSQSISCINNIKVQAIKTSDTILQLNQNSISANCSCTQNESAEQHINSTSNINSVPVNIPHLPIPKLQNKVQKGQKVPLFSNTISPFIDVLLGWNVKNDKCDVDVSSFLLDSSGKVLGDSWFVFYGQPASPDKSVNFSSCSSNDRQKIHIDLNHINKEIKKIVFVLTINEALSNHLNFGMIEDAYIRIVDNLGKELCSFVMTDYYSNVISMMIGEIYQHNDTWKFNAVGNGVSKDLAGLCELYGVAVN